MSFLYTIGLLSLGTSFGFVLGAIMTSGKRADDDLDATPGLVEALLTIKEKTFDAQTSASAATIIGSRERNSEPHLVLISPTEMREVKTV